MLIRGLVHERLELTVEKVIPGASVASLGRLERLLEPNVVVGRVIGDDVDETLDVDLLELGHHLVKVFQSTDPRVDISVVGHVVCRQFRLTRLKLATYILRL